MPPQPEVLTAIYGSRGLTHDGCHIEVETISQILVTVIFSLAAVCVCLALIREHLHRMLCGSPGRRKKDKSNQPKEATQPKEKKHKQKPNLKRRGSSILGLVNANAASDLAEAESALEGAQNDLVEAHVQLADKSADAARYMHEAADLKARLVEMERMMVMMRRSSRFSSGDEAEPAPAEEEEEEEEEKEEEEEPASANDDDSLVSRQRPAQTLPPPKRRSFGGFNSCRGQRKSERSEDTLGSSNLGSRTLSHRLRSRWRVSQTSSRASARSPDTQKGSDDKHATELLQLPGPSEVQTDGGQSSDAAVIQEAALALGVKHGTDWNADRIRVAELAAEEAVEQEDDIAKRKAAKRAERKEELTEADDLGEDTQTRRQRMKDRPGILSTRKRRGDPENDEGSFTKRKHYFKYAVGDRVKDGVRGVGTVEELLKDGRMKIVFDSGQEDFYKPSDIRKVVLVHAAQDEASKGTELEPSDVSSDSPEAQQQWSAKEWMNSLNLHEPLTAALIAPLDALTTGDTQFAYCQRLSDAEIERLLGDNDVLGRVVSLVKHGVKELMKQRAATGSALSAKFASESKYTLETGSLDYFFRGLEGLLGPPATDVFKGMEREHSDEDADVLFDTSNGIRTTSRDEYEFVVKPIRGKAYPERAALRATPQRCRRPLTLDEIWEAVASCNTALRELREPELIKEEVAGGRLYSGPMYEKYNAVLRAETGNPMLVQKCEALTRGNRYATSIHAVTSCVLKLAKVTKACKVYRGLKDAQLPEAFFKPNKYGVRGGIEFGFTSTSKSRDEALSYAVDMGGAPTIFEMQTGMVDRGASISVLSQYPWEEEILFAPLLGMEVQHTRVNGNTLVVQLRLTVNLTALSLEEQLCKRKRLVHQMCDSLRDELRYDHCHKVEWKPFELLKRPDDNWNGLEASFSTLDLQLHRASDHEVLYYNDDQSLGDAIALAVRGAQRVQAWPSALARLAGLTRLDVKGMLKAKQIVVNFSQCKLAEAEVTSVLLRASHSLQTLTLFDGNNQHGSGKVPDWDEAVRAIAVGLRASMSLQHLNLRNFDLGPEGSTHMSAALSSKTRMLSIRTFAVGLTPSALAVLLRGNTTLRHVDVSNNPGLGEPGNGKASSSAPAAQDRAADDAGRVGETLAKFITGNPTLRGLVVARCALPPRVGLQIADALMTRIEQDDLLRTLDLSENHLDPAAGLALATALAKSQQLTTFNASGNPMDAVTFKAIHDAKQRVAKAWAKTDEGRKQELLREKNQKHNAGTSGAFELFGLVTG